MSADSKNELDEIKKEFQSLCLKIIAIKNKKAQDERNNNPHSSKLDCEGCKKKEIIQTWKRSSDQDERNNNPHGSKLDCEGCKKKQIIRTSKGSSDQTSVRDINNKVIRIGNRVRFITKGLHNSTEGTVYKISKNGKRVTSLDDKGMPISRAPYNLQIIRD